MKYVVTDLWKTYKDLANTYFSNAKVVADKFHFVRYTTEAVDTVRKQVQDKLPRYKNLKDLFLGHNMKMLSAYT